MELREFRKRMNRVRKEIELDPYGTGVCIELSRAFTSDRLRNTFNEIFKPDDGFGYWLNSSCSYNKHDRLNQLKRRLLFVDAFQGYCESEKLYESVWGY